MKTPKLSAEPRTTATKMQHVVMIAIGSDHDLARPAARSRRTVISDPTG
jgi:hypothetical protein